jgi:DNA-binding protein HU-beta
MTKSELINAVHAAAAEQKLDITKKATGELIDLVFEQVAGAINGAERFSYPSFGTFSVKHRKAREGRNPRTKEKITIPASNTVSFKPAPDLRDKINVAAAAPAAKPAAKAAAAKPAAKAAAAKPAAAAAPAAKPAAKKK